MDEALAPLTALGGNPFGQLCEWPGRCLGDFFANSVKALGAFGKFWVNNAGVGSPFGTLRKPTKGPPRPAHGINPKGVWLCMRGAPRPCPKGSGHIINMAFGV
ncbi:MAG: hypothetical protein CM15mP74_08680 [Halieaceae bacterium]|nr:MAG: hypothetical protein CM15mP74_08680 [Halieaceae bacterium]